MKKRDKVIIGVLGACLAVAAGIWMEVRTCRRMRAAVEQALEMNRTFQPFTSDTIYLSPHSSPTSTPFPSGEGRGEAISLRRAVAYYDHPLRRLWTSPNDRLRAGYALGCVYRDLHEAPIAIITWEDAVAAADTTAADCDYATLYRVYGQMADIYFRQYMPDKELDARKKFDKYALMANDTLNYIRGQLLKNEAYLSLGDTAAVFENIKHVRLLYLERGLKQEAAQVYPSAIHIALDRGEYERADSMMQIFEKESGLFDEHGDIAPAREIYYYRKGSYFLGIHQLDSAEFQFRRLLKYEPNLIDAYRGLISLYLVKENKDSIRKYTTLYEDALAQYLDGTQIQAISQAEGMYNYSRQQRIAAVEKRRADILKVTGIVLVFVFVASVEIIVRKNKKTRDQERRNLVQLRAQYSDVIKKLAAVRKEISFLQRSTSKNDNVIDILKKEKEELALMYEEQIAHLKSVLSSYKESQNGIEMKATILGHFHAIAKPHIEKDENGRSVRIGARKATDEEWLQLLEMTQICYPRFYAFLMEYSLSELKLHVCLLSRYGFENKDILTLADSSLRSVSNARLALAKTLFGLNSTKDLDSYLKDI